MAESFPDGAFLGTLGHDRSIASFYLLGDIAGLGEDLTWLGAEAAEALTSKGLRGKAVLDIS